MNLSPAQGIVIKPRDILTVVQNRGIVAIAPLSINMCSDASKVHLRGTLHEALPRKKLARRRVNLAGSVVHKALAISIKKLFLFFRREELRYFIGRRLDSLSAPREKIRPTRLLPHNLFYVTPVTHKLVCA